MENIYTYIAPEFVESFEGESELRSYLLETSGLSNNNDRSLIVDGRKWDIKLTTGTTGKPFPVVVNQMEQFMSTKKIMKKRKKYFDDANLNNGFLLAHEVDNNIKRMNYRRGDSDMHEVIDYFIEKQPSWMFVSVNSLKRFVMAALNYRLDEVKKIDVRFIEVTGARMYSEDETLVRKVFRCPFVNQYGCREAWYIAYQCTCGNLHINTENVIVDVVNEKGEIIKEDNALGEVVVTNLYAKTMPFLKYYLGDYARISSEKCLCGEGSPLLFLEGGRITEQLKNTRYNGGEVFRQVLRVLCFKKGVEYNSIYMIRDDEYHLSVFVDLLSEQTVFEQEFVTVSRAIIENFDAFAVTYVYNDFFNGRDTFLKEPIFMCKI